MRRVSTFCLVATLGLAGLIGFAWGETAEIHPVVIDYFYEAGCPDCVKVKNRIMPELRDQFEGFYLINRYDMSLETNVIKLTAYHKQLGVTGNEPVSMFVDYQHVFNGFKAIETGLIKQMHESVSAHLDPNWRQPVPIEAGGVADVVDRFKGFTLPVVLINGLLDGLNPCAIGTLVFFMSMLAVSKVKGKGLLMMGVAFCLASFVTYTAIGLGLLHLIHALSGFERVRTGIEIGMIVILAILSLLSFRDAWRFRSSGKVGDVALQLPDRLKGAIRGVMRRQLKTRHLVSGGLVIGAAVTALESVCTGQVYVPTMVLVIKSAGEEVVTGAELLARAWQYLLLYNTMFIVPLVVVFILTYLGLRTETLLAWSKRHVVLSKVLLGVFFLAMAALIWVM